MNILKTVFGKLVLIKNLFLKQSLIKKIVIVAIIAAIGWFGVKPAILGSQQQQVQYQTAIAEKGTLITSVTASGTVSSGSSASITSSATGIVQEVYVENGDTVSEGDPIALIKLDKSSQQQQAQAWASYLSAQNTLNTAKAKMNSLQSALFKANQTFVNGKGTADPDTDDPVYIQQRADWLQAEADYNNQANVIKQAEAALSSSWLSYSQLSPTITAPMSGVVGNLSITPGLTISGSNQSDSTSTTGSNTASTQTVGTITLEDGTPQVSVNLTEIDVVKVKPGQKVTLTLDSHPDKTFTGKVSAVNTNGSVSSGVTTYPATITLDTAVDTIYPNMAVNATIITDIKNNVILVPSGAVQTSNGASTVRVMKAGQPTSVQVEVGGSNDTQTEILSGVNVEDTVVTGQTGGATTPGSTGAATSPFGNTRGGFGGAGGFGGGGAQIQRR
jgi:macrolide-specific efflux system membrane fusion protein